ncbi:MULTISPECIES: type II secretion system secretin GspD [unclassified Janthinobacterium]|uniref:type II secretion system secretin GspD n=1 Tax=unclassified Janthinobacterium TaxID=2610881 RepID=UPI00160A36D9|nr:MULTISPECIES: type II secretion system secretin GspD [unclassified Janthinobacterium]MBB5370311.1 general secretion pathway protein D [Janthinobacterium sp. K2C7]MBB5383117.1 general secretion pathway protein D [Janthinobacterium sp. K2Li3]MBB5388404.1 general secretion pathway protein D [Janthinobacterium sp. K2E3]
MKKPSVSPNKSSFSLRRLSAAALLCCSVAGMPAPAWSAPGDEAALNFVGADIESVIKAVGHYTNINFVIDPRVKGTITLVSEKSITKTQAFGLLASALRLQGYAVVSGDGYAKVVPEADAKLQSVPTQVGGGASQVKGDQIATQVFYLSYESSANLLAVLRPLISPNNTINANPGNNSLVITDYADNLKRLAKIIAALDVPASTDLDVIPVRYAIASDLASMVNKLMEGSGGAAAGADAGKVSVLADPRTNSLVLRAPSVARANLAKSLISKLDQPTTQLGNVHVVYLKNADATKLAQTLRSVVTSDGTAAGGQQNNAGNLNNQGLNNQGINNNSNSGGINSSSGLGGNTQNGTSGGASLNNGPQQLSSGGAAGFIQADASTNTLILTCNEAVYRNLRAVIDQLDVRRAQVYIEALIVEVTSAKASEFGVQWAGLSGNSNSNYRVGVLQSFAGGTSNNIGAIATGKGAVLPTDGLNVGIFKQINGALGLGAVAHALESDGNANILSTPNLITLDNELATIKVGQNVPILTGQYTSTAGTNSNPFQTIDRKDVGLTLKVRPQISEGGTIKMSIYHETSSVDKSTASAVSGITINNRVIENSVLADDGQIIVLGGLIEDSTSDNAEKVRGLGDIPVLGNLFKYQTRSRTKTNLMIFLRPVIVRSKEQSGSLASDRYDYMRAAEEMAVPATGNLMLKDLGTPVLPALQNGQPVGGGMVSRPVPPAPAPLGAPGNAVTPAAEAQPQLQPQPQN